MAPRIVRERNENRRESPRESVPSPCGIGITFDMWRPIIQAAREIIKPAIGPDAPISMSAFRVSMGDFIFIKAPKVPKMEGAGIKYGNVAAVWFFLDAR